MAAILVKDKLKTISKILKLDFGRKPTQKVKEKEILVSMKATYFFLESTFCAVSNGIWSTALL